ncbi:hemagglutinin repeat-containing protein [Achromobacter sp. NCFB-sbj8-Ac1-l]|uniref:hemagglutinin repeat-containing protein n=1 Tax=unclassified Achromobacter TaxID=2626865 RepID=UPI004046B753
MGLTVGGSQNGFASNVGAGGSTNKGSGQDSSWNNTHVVAGNRLTLNSGSDTVLRGAQARAAQIVATVGGNLVIESLQDISNYVARDRSGGVQVSLCIPPICYGASSVSGNYGQTKINSQYASVTEQTGMWAGDGGFQLNVGKNTGLIGGVIASSDKAVADGKNVLITGTLTSRDIENRASYEGQSVQLGGGFNFGGGAAGGKAGGKDGAKGSGSGSTPSAIGTDNQGNVAGGSKATPGSTLPSLDGISANVPIAMGASGEASSTTKSAVSGGTIVIRDEAGQKALTGQTAAEAIAALNRDTKDTLNALDRIFDEKEVRAGFEVTAELSRQVGQYVVNRKAELEALKARSEDASLPYGERIQAVRDYAEMESRWGQTGTLLQWSTAILGAASGNVVGGAGQFIQAAAVNYLQALGATKIKELSAQLGGEGSAGHAALHALLGCAGAAAQNNVCGAGAAGALSGVVLNKLLESVDGRETKDLSPDEAKARMNLLTSIVAGISAGIDPSVAAPAVNAAVIESENNTSYRYRGKVARFKAELYDKLEAKCGNDGPCYQAEFDRADRMAAAYDVSLILGQYPSLTKEKADTLAQAVLDLAPGVSNASALYELVTGKTATGEDANRFFAAIGVVPVLGGIVKKGGQALHTFADAEKALDVGKVRGTPKPTGGKGIPGFNQVESGVLNEAKAILNSSELARIQAAHVAGKPIEINIGGRLIQYEPGLPASGMTMFGENGFLIGREAFKSPAELQKTILHELHRLSTSQSSGGVSAALASHETQAAYDFAEKAFQYLNEAKK